MSDPKKVKKEVKAWAVIDNDGIIEHLDSSLALFSEKEAASATWGSRRAVRATITYEVEQ